MTGQANGLKCRVCGRALTGRQTKWCGKSHQMQAWRSRSGGDPTSRHSVVVTPGLPSWAAVLEELDAMVEVWPSDLAALEAAGVDDEFLGDLESHMHGAEQIRDFLLRHVPDLGPINDSTKGHNE